MQQVVQLNVVKVNENVMLRTAEMMQSAPQVLQTLIVYIQKINVDMFPAFDLSMYAWNNSLGSSLSVKCVLIWLV